MNQNLNPDSNTKGTLILLIIFSVLAFFCVLINGRVFNIVYINSRRKSRPANILVAHLAAVVIGFTCVVFIHFLNKSNVINLGSHGICNLLPISARGLHNIFSLNLGAIIWVRTKYNAVNIGKFLACFAIVVMWTIVFLANLPYIFMAEYTQQTATKLNQCKKISILGSFAITIIYEGLKVLLFSVIIWIYVIQVTLKIRSSLKFLESQLFRSEKTKKKIQQIRHVQWHSIILISWFPHGIGSFLYKMFGHLGWRSSHDVTYTIPAVIYVYTIFILCPLSYVCLLEEISVIKFFLPCWRKKEAPNFLGNVRNWQQNDLEASGWKMELPLEQKSRFLQKQMAVKWSKKKNGVKIQENYDHLALVEISLLTTVGSTRTSAVVTKAAPVVVDLNESSVNSSLIKAVRRPSTSQKLTSVTAEVHLEPENCDEQSEPGFGKRNSEILI